MVPVQACREKTSRPGVGYQQCATGLERTVWSSVGNEVTTKADYHHSPSATTSTTPKESCVLIDPRLTAECEA